MIHRYWANNMPNTDHLTYSFVTSSIEVDYHVIKRKLFKFPHSQLTFDQSKAIKGRPNEWTSFTQLIHLSQQRDFSSFLDDFSIFKLTR